MALSNKDWANIVMALTTLGKAPVAAYPESGPAILAEQGRQLAAAKVAQEELKEAEKKAKKKAKKAGWIKLGATAVGALTGGLAAPAGAALAGATAGAQLGSAGGSALGSAMIGQPLQYSDYANALRDVDLSVWSRKRRERREYPLIGPV